MNYDRPVLVSAIKPTGDLHIGNYFGAMRQFVELTKNGKYKSFIFVADYHALNYVQNAEEMRKRTRETVLAYLAIGLDPEDITFFKQSDVPAHTELCWIFDSVTTMPYLMRSHAFKDAQAKNKDINVGTFNYPMLMAADILLYDASIVPVGADQKQHIEIARDTAEKFNRTFMTDVFKLPEAYIMPDVAIVPGIDGRKMSKSYGNVIPLISSKDELADTVMKIVTDSNNGLPENVYNIHKMFRSERELKIIYEENAGNYKKLKELLTDDADRYLSPIRLRYKELNAENDLTDVVLEKGRNEARYVTERKMANVKRAIGTV